MNKKSYLEILTLEAKDFIPAFLPIFTIPLPGFYDKDNQACSAIMGMNSSNLQIASFYVDQRGLLDLQKSPCFILKKVWQDDNIISIGLQNEF